ncbi:MAG: radical SAM protein [Candidatus Omnitrophica bacterium]|nr:radical SAM protein [Candidatus Omnitrophota bacterium]MBU1924487.1 radical SAM protein [Candidatus Omnitrophota bacterium]
MLAYLKFVGRLFKARFLNQRIPLIAILCVTNKCNLKCWYCYGEHPYRNNSLEFTKEELAGIITGLHDMGVQIVQLQGGEPLLRNDLKELVLQIKKQGMICDLVTNGVLIPERIETVRLLDTICISLDGPQELTDKNRGPGIFVRAVEGITCACAQNLPVRLSAVLTKATKKSDIDWLIHFAEDKGVLVNFSPFFQFKPQFSSSRAEDFNIDEPQLRDLLHYIAGRKRGKAPIQFTAASYEAAAAWPFPFSGGKRREEILDAAYVKLKGKCRHGDLVVFIDSDGSVYPCCNFWGEAKLNIRKQGIKKAILGVERDGCESCYIPAYIDRNSFFNGQPGVWLNYLNQGISRLRLKKFRKVKTNAK